MSAAKRILIVDDEPNIRLVFKTALASPEYLLSTAVDGEMALMWLKTEPFDLVLLDLMMPGIKGLEVLESLRNEGNNVPVVMITAHGTIPDAVAAMKLGAIDFLAKPLDPATLRNTVADVLARNAETASPEPRGEPVTASSQFAQNMARAKAALNRRDWQTAEVFLRQAIALDANSAEAHNLMGVLHECRNEHDASYREYRAALKADHRYEPAKHNMQRYYERFTFGRSQVRLDLGFENRNVSNRG
jgi:DNA-binding NtrC family response regulator